MNNAEMELCVDFCNKALKESAMSLDVLFLARKEHLYAEAAADFVKKHFQKSAIAKGERGKRPPHLDFKVYKFDYIISYLYPHIIEEWFLVLAKKAAINFHPNPYRGAGGANWAIYNNLPKYSVICHHMVPKVDAGDIIDIRKFWIYRTDSVYSLYQRAQGYLLSMFYDIMDLILLNRELPVSKEKWMSDKLYTLKDLEKLRRVTSDMDYTEVDRRIKATEYPGFPSAYIDHAGYEWELKY